VPPKGVFGDLLETDHSINLISVPSCDACNHPATKDDVYFRDALFVTSSDSLEQRTPDAVRAAVVRSIKHAGNYFDTPISIFLRESQPGWGSVGGASTLQPVRAVRIRWDRIKRTIERTVRGLYWHHRCARVPDDFDVTILGDKERSKFGFTQAAEFREIVSSTLQGTKCIVHREAFAYSIAFAADDPSVASILLCFYGRVIFLALIGLPERPSRLALI
jgi:hypothetical protein